MARELKVIAVSQGLNRHQHRAAERNEGKGGLNFHQKAAKARRQRQKMKRHKKRFHLN